MGWGPTRPSFWHDVVQLHEPKSTGHFTEDESIGPLTTTTITAEKSTVPPSFTVLT